MLKVRLKVFEYSHFSRRELWSPHCPLWPQALLQKYNDLLMPLPRQKSEVETEGRQSICQNSTCSTHACLETDFVCVCEQERQRFFSSDSGQYLQSTELVHRERGAPLHYLRKKKPPRYKALFIAVKQSKLLCPPLGQTLNWMETLFQISGTEETFTFGSSTSRVKNDNT